MTFSLPKNERKNTQLSLFPNNNFYKYAYLEIGNQKSIDRMKEIDLLTEIFYRNLH